VKGFSIRRSFHATRRFLPRESLRRRTLSLVRQRPDAAAMNPEEYNRTSAFDIESSNDVINDEIKETGFVAIGNVSSDQILSPSSATGDKPQSSWGSLKLPNCTTRRDEI